MAENILSARVEANPAICGIELCFDGTLTPSTIVGWQPFHNSMMTNAEFIEAYSGKGYLEFSEVSQDSKSGISYKQTAKLRFPATDAQRAERFHLATQARFIKIKLNNGLDIVIGRNDFYQNARPKVAIKSNHQAAEVEYETVSIMPSGYVANSDVFGLPMLIPVSFNI